MKTAGIQFLLWFLCFTAILCAQRNESLAVLDLEGRGISAAETASLTDRLRSELVKTAEVTVVERGQMNRILTEQDFQLTGCTSDECAVEVGQLLGVSQMVAGSIGKLGNTYLLDIRIINVQTGAIVETMTRNYRGEIDGLIEQIESLAWDIVGKPRLEEITLMEEEPEPVPEPEEVAQPKKKSRWLLYVAGAAILGGGAAYLLTSGGAAPPVSDIPLPPQLPPVE
ncbi:MAG: CsgG/HfaB family protein [Candidatus Neomarinimicrobiota bacterium]